DLLELWSQPGYYLVSGYVTFALGFERDEEASVVERGRCATVADGHGVGRHGGITSDDFAQYLLTPFHLLEGDILAGFRDAGDHSGVLLREEPLGDDDEEIHRDSQRRQKHAQRRELVPQHEIQAPLITRKHAIETAFRDLIETPMLGTAFVT